MKKHLLNIATAISVLLSVGAIIYILNTTPAEAKESGISCMIIFIYGWCSILVLILFALILICRLFLRNIF